MGVCRDGRGAWWFCRLPLGDCFVGGLFVCLVGAEETIREMLVLRIERKSGTNLGFLTSVSESGSKQSQSMLRGSGRHRAALTDDWKGLRVRRLPPERQALGSACWRRRECFRMPEAHVY